VAKAVKICVTQNVPDTVFAVYLGTSSVSNRFSVSGTIHKRSFQMKKISFTGYFNFGLCLVSLLLFITCATSEKAQLDKYETLLKRGIENGENGENNQAIEYFSSALNVKPDGHEALYGRAVAYTNIGDYAKAIKDCSTGLDIKPNDPKFLYIRGFSNGKNGNIDQAFDDLTNALIGDPNLYQARVARGMIYAEKRDFDRAFDDLNKALNINPDYHQALWSRGRIYAINGYLDQAILDFNKAITIKSDYYEALRDCGYAHLLNKDIDHAITYFSNALTIEPYDFDTLIKRGGAYAMNGNYNLAIKDWETVLQIDQDNIDALTNLNGAISKLDDNIAIGDRAEEYFAKGDFDMALVCFNDLLSKYPYSLVGLYNRGLVLCEKKEFVLAIEDLNNADKIAIKIRPDFWQAKYQRGIAYYRIGNLDKAIDDFEAVLLINPYSSNTRNALETARHQRGY
jgi:tetratricopeptide (TPR) repeat protein